MKFAPFHSRSRHGGFTLVELLLAVTLLAGLMGAAVFGFSSLQRSAQLNEGVERVETAMRFARAHAANTGRKVQVVVTTTVDANLSASSSSSADKPASNGNGNSNGNNYGSSNGNEPLHSLSILWEADPARAPGVFESIPSLSGDVADVSELVEIRSVGRESKNSESNDGLMTQDSQDVGNPRTQTGTASDSLEFSNNSMNSGANLAANNTSDSETGSEASRPSAGSANPGETTITFYPDGSCDGATIVLASRDSDDSREVAVHLESVTGTTRRHWKESTGLGVSQTGFSPSSPASSDLGSSPARSNQKSSSPTAASPATSKARR
ncbi:MAG: prepilin-type N-terminal cleavage/methylation domain-containing protein [Verrucomicrobia bacterium]|nr:prepilin-type N-terminal cleavage/methylation domain-containing protein [Verrucomicrobiota bacterium]